MADMNCLGRGQTSTVNECPRRALANEKAHRATVGFLFQASRLIARTLHPTARPGCIYLFRRHTGQLAKRACPGGKTPALLAA
jgi:hypothetical protein